MKEINTLRTRTFSSIIYVLIFLAAVFIDNWFFLIFCLGVHIGCWIELQRIFKRLKITLRHNAKIHDYGIIIASSGFLLFIFNHFMINKNEFLEQLGWGLFLICTFTIPLIDFLLMDISLPKVDFIKKILYDLCGFFYITISFTLLLLLKTWGIFTISTGVMGIEYGTVFVLTLVFSIWLTDSMAYLGGSAFGKTPFFSHISPKKTWEGTWIGIVMSITVVTLFAHIFFYELRHILIGIAVIASIMGTLGDLLESKLKRMANIKDSGNIMPGHGGFLDRFDSIIVATPFVFVYIILVFFYKFL